MPFPTRYTRIPYIADDAEDIAIDRQRGLFWTLTGGGYSYHDPDFETFEDGPNFFKIRMSDGVVLASGRGPLVEWNYEDNHTSPENVANNFETDSFSIAPSTGNLYVETYNRYSSTGQIHCLDPNDFHILFSSPLLTGTFRATDWIVVFEPYVYYLSYIPGGSPPMRLGVTRLPLSLAQVDWSAITYSGVDSFEIPSNGDIAVDSAGNVWSGCMKTLAKVSPTGVVTTYDLSASLNANACIKTVGYDAGTNSLGMLVKLRASNGTGAVVAPYMQIVKVNCATGAVTATFSPPASLRFVPDPFYRAWENIYDGRLLLKLDRTISGGNTPENRGAHVDFDLRSMSILRIYSMTRDWELDPTPVEPEYQESPLDCGQRAYQVIPDFATRSIWVYNGYHGWIYPDSEYPQGTYGVWRFSLNECASYIPFPTETTWTSTNLAFDRERGVVWAMMMDPPTLWKIRTSDGQVLLSARGDIPDGSAAPDWIANWMEVSQETGNLYLDDNDGDTVRIRCVSGTDLQLLYTSPFFPLPYVYMRIIVIHEPHVYVYCENAIDYSTIAIFRLPMDLHQIDWMAEWSPPYFDTDFYAGTLPMDAGGNIWVGSSGTSGPRYARLARINASGALQEYNLDAQLPASTYIAAMGYDPVTPSLLLLLEDGPTGNGRLARFNLNSLSVDIAQATSAIPLLSGWGLGGSEPRNWNRLPNGRVWLRENHNITANPIVSGFIEFDVPSMTVVRSFNLTSDWCITGVATGEPQFVARRTHGYLWDDCACCLWMFNGYAWIYPALTPPSGSEGVWKLPLPDQPAVDCPSGVPECPTPPWLEYFHDVPLDTYISYDCKIAVKFQTYITRMREGHEERIGEWQDPIWTFDVTPALRDQADLDYLLAFFRARHGPQYIFKFFNPLDNRVTNEVFAVGDGVTSEFQLSRRYQTGIAGDNYYYVRPIFLPVSGVQIFDNGVLVPANTYTLCPLGGLVLFGAAPATGHMLTWTGSYYTPVRFLNNRVYSIVEHYEHFEDKIMLVEERLSIEGAILPEAESPDFLDVLFPYRYAQRASMGPEIDVITVTSDSGVTFRKAQFKSAKIRFTVEETEQPMAIIQQILAFFLNRKGRLISFRARDITDFELVKEPMQAADGVRTQFQLVKNYVSGEQTDVRTIAKPNGDIIVYDGDVEIVPQPTIDTSSGTVTFATPPAAEVQLNCSGTFDVPVRFDSDEMTFSIKGFEWFNMEAMNLIETELGLPSFTVDPLLPALFTSADRPLPRFPMAGQDTCALPPRPAVTKYLEFRGAAGTGLQVERPGSLYTLLSSASSLTVAMLVSHVKTGTVTGVVGAVYPMALLSHVMPGMGTDPTVYASTGFTLYLANFGAGIALDASLGAYKYSTSGALCVPELDLTPRVPAQGTQSASIIADNEHMHAYVVTMDWLSRQAYWSGTIYGKQDFPLEVFAYNMCLAGVGGADARLFDATASSYIAAKDLAIGQGETANDGWLGAVGQAPQVPAFHSPLAARVYEHLFLPTFGRVDMQRILRDVHTPILRYWGSKYGAGFPNTQSPVAPGFDLFWWRADENITVADAPSGAIAAWAPVACGFQWLKPDSAALQDDGQPRLQPLETLPVFDDVLMLADGRRLLARQT